jgi:hypothetical protein
VGGSWARACREIGGKVREESDEWGRGVREREGKGVAGLVRGFAGLVLSRVGLVAAPFLFSCSETFSFFCFSVLCCLQKQTCLKREISNSENF